MLQKILTWASPVIRGTGIVLAFAISFLKLPPELEGKGNMQDREMQEIQVLSKCEMET